MDLLVLSTWFPFPPDNGSRLRAFHLLRELARRGHRLRLIAGLQPDVAGAAGDAAPLHAFCETVVAVPWRWHRREESAPLGGLRAALSPVPRSVLETPNPELTAAIAAALAARRPDAVLVLEMGMDAHLPTLPACLPAVLEGVEASGMARPGLRASLTLAKARGYWRRRLRRYAAVTTVSEPEADSVRRLLLDVSAAKPSVVPNGVDLDAYPPREPGIIVPGRLIYNGSLTYGPNREAVRWFARDILPRIAAAVPDVHLHVTGRYDEEAGREFAGEPRVTLTGLLPDIAPALAEAAVCVVPLRKGGGTRLKILEAWAAGVPVVSTPVGAAGLGGRGGEHLLLADDPDAFARATAELLNDPARAERLAWSARTLVEREYAWAAAAARLEAVLIAVTANATTATTIR